MNLDQKALEKKKQFEQQHQEREQKLFKMVDDRIKSNELTKDPQELMTVIKKEFDSRLAQIKQNLKEFNVETQKIQSMFEQHQELNNYYVQQNYCLLSYDKQLYKEQLSKLFDEISQLQMKIKPQEKFRFSEKAKQSFLKKQTAKQQKAETQNEEKKELFKIKAIENKQNEELVLNRSDLEKESYKIMKNKGCKIWMNQKFETIYIYENENCEIYLGPVSSSVFVEKCENCTIYIMAQQIRIHNTNNTTFRIYSASKSIIENCKQLKFGVYDYKYEGIEEDIKQNGFDSKPNLWDQIQDFNWIKQEKSPNYELI